jgi:UDP-N-acetyl-D-mannosaminuronate dehydrogenase
MGRLGVNFWTPQKKEFEINFMKIVVVGLGYVGLSNAVLLAQHNEVIGVDVSQERVDAWRAPIG